MPKINQTTWIVALSTIDSGIVNELVEPEVPGIVTITNPDGGKIINFTAGTEGTSPITSYVASVIPSGPTATVVSADLAVGGYVELSDFTFDTDYIVSISAVNEFGQGEAAYTNSFIIEDVYNEASGGIETIVSDYNGTGERWKVHTFLADETFEVTSSPNPFRVLVVGSGGRGGFCSNSLQGGGGGAGRMIEDNAFEIVEGSHSVVVGDGTASTITNFYGINAPAGGTGGNQSGGSGGNGGSGGGGGATFGGDTVYGMNVAGTPIAGYGNDGSTSRGTPQTQSGGGGGAATAGGLSGAAGLGRANNISGVEIVYATGGSVGAAPGLEGSGNGGLGAVTDGESGSFGGSGVVIVAYEISSAFNEASGGIETIIDDYNGTGEQWKTHTFFATDTLNITSSFRPFSYLLVGRGGDPGTFPANSGGVGGGGGGGGFLNKTDQVIPAGSYEVVIANPVSFNGDSAATGDRGQGESNGSNGGASGAPTRHSGGGPYIPWEGGGGGGSGGNGSNGAGNGSPPGGAGLVSNITGSNTAYGAGGGGQIQSWNSAIAGKGFYGQNAGIVVAYQIGVSTLAQIKVAQTVRKAELRKQQLEEKALKKQEALEDKLRK